MPVKDKPLTLDFDDVNKRIKKILKEDDGSKKERIKFGFNDVKKA